MAGPFQTPQNEKSFSGLIDQVLLDTGRPAALLSAIQYANAVIRECHNLGLFAQDLIEEQWVITANPFQLERPNRFRKMRTMQFDCSKTYPRLMLPGRQLYDECEYYYAADDYFVVKGGVVGTYLNTAIYYFPRSFLYYPRLGATNTTTYPGGNYSTRPAYFDKEAEVWMYLTLDGTAYVTTLGDPTEEQKRRDLTLNWMLRNNFECVMEGTKSRIFTLYSDSRAPTSYSQYKSMQADVKIGTAFESEDF